MLYKRFAELTNDSQGTYFVINYSPRPRFVKKDSQPDGAEPISTGSPLMRAARLIDRTFAELIKGSLV